MPGGALFFCHECTCCTILMRSTADAAWIAQRGFASILYWLVLACSDLAQIRDVGLICDLRMSWSCDPALMTREPAGHLTCCRATKKNGHSSTFLTGSNEAASASQYRGPHGKKGRVPEFNNVEHAVAQSARVPAWQPERRHQRRLLGRTVLGGLQLGCVS